MGELNLKEDINSIMEEEETEYSIYRNDERWGIHDLNSLVWADSIINDKEQAIAEKEAIADNNIEKLKNKIKLLEEWKENATKKEKSDIDFFQSHMMVYHMKLIDTEKAENLTLKSANKKEKPITKSIKLPFSTLTCRVQDAEAFVGGKELTKAKDDPTFVKFVKDSNPELIYEEVKWAEYKKTLTDKIVNGKLVYLDSDSNIVDVISLVERGEKFVRKPIKKEKE